MRCLLVTVLVCAVIASAGALNVTTQVRDDVLCAGDAGGDYSAVT